MIRPRAIFCAAWLALGVIVLDGAALANVDPRALVLFELGRIDLAAGRYEEALRKFADSQRLDPGAGTMLNLAFCYEKLGKVATAWAEYHAAAVLAREQAKLDWERDALAQARRLEPSLPRVVVQVAEPKDGEWPEVLLDNSALPKSLWGEPTPVDPGPHEVLAKATGRRSWTQTFEVDHEHVPTVVVPVLEPVEAPLPEAKGQVGTGATVGPVGKADIGATGKRESRRSAPVPTRKVAALVMGAVGVAALGAGAAFGLMARSSYNGAECANHHCTPKGLDTQARAFGESDIASVAAAAGGAALIGAGILWMVSPSRPGGLHLSPAVDRAACGVSMQGAW